MESAEKTENHVQLFESSPAVAELFAALSKVQGELDGVDKDAVNPAFKDRDNAAKSKGTGYATLGNVIAACKAPLQSNGFCIIQTTGVVGDTMYLITTLGHKTGQWIRSIYPLKPVKSDPQGMGSAMTYARRYCYMAIVGIAPVDDDGNDGSSVGTPSGGNNANTQQRQQHVNGQQQMRDNGTQNSARNEGHLNTNTSGQNRSSAQPDASAPPIKEPTADNIAMYQSLVAQVEKYGLESPPVKAIIEMIKKAPDDVKDLSEAYRKAGKKHAGLMAMVVMGHEQRVINLLPKPDATSDPEI